MLPESRSALAGAVGQARIADEAGRAGRERGTVVTLGGAPDALAGRTVLEVPGGTGEQTVPVEFEPVDGAETGVLQGCGLEPGAAGFADCEAVRAACAIRDGAGFAPLGVIIYLEPGDAGLAVRGARALVAGPGAGHADIRVVSLEVPRWAVHETLGAEQVEPCLAGPALGNEPAVAGRALIRADLLGKKKK